MSDVAGKSDLVDLEMKLHYEKPGGNSAILVSLDGERKNAVWLPKSLIEYEDKGKGLLEVTLPEWLAIEKELV